MKISRSTFDESFRSVAVVLAVLGALAVFSFLMAGLVGEREKMHTASYSQSHPAG